MSSPLRGRGRPWLRAAFIPLIIAAAFSAQAASPALAQTVLGPTGTYYVDGSSTGGPCSDLYTFTQAQSPATPWCTISKAAANVSPGSVIKIAPGVYHEAVTLKPNDDSVTLEGVGSSKPIIDGDWTRQFGIQLINGVHDVTIDGFEIRDMVCPATGRAEAILSTNTYHDTIENNVIHAIRSAGVFDYGIMLGASLAPGLVHDVSILNNRIYDIGPGGEATGIFLAMTKNMTVAGNETYLIRKEGIRDWFGLNNTFTSNRMYLTWTGITLESAIGDLVDNNVSYFNAWAYNPKHVSEAGALTRWGLTTGQWSRFWHNTAYGNTHADMSFGQNPPNEDYIDVRDNVFASPGDVHLHDFPTVRGSNIIVDYNVYSGSAPIYYANWTTPHQSVYTTLSALQAGLGWETHGQTFTPAFANPSAGDFSFSTAGLQPGVSLPDAFGAQLGAANVAPASYSWTRYPTAVAATTPEPPYVAEPNAGDGRDDSYWWSTNYNTNGAVTYDLGAPEPMNTFVLDYYAHMDPRNPKGYSIQVSNDGVSWTTVTSGTNPDSEGSSYKYTLATPVTARYVKFNMLSNFGATTLVFADFEIGLLLPAGTPTPVVTTNPTSTPVAHTTTASPTGTITQARAARTAAIKARTAQVKRQRRLAAHRGATPVRRATHHVHSKRHLRRSHRRRHASHRHTLRHNWARR